MSQSEQSKRTHDFISTIFSTISSFSKLFFPSSVFVLCNNSMNKKKIIKKRKRPKIAMHYYIPSSTSKNILIKSNRFKIVDKFPNVK